MKALIQSEIIVFICVFSLGTLNVATGQKKDSTWITTESGCKIYNPNPVRNESITWTGPCHDGYASGNGTLTWFKNKKSEDYYIGTLKRGSPHGKGKYTFISQYRLVRGDGFLNTFWDYFTGDETEEGEYVNGELEGHGVLTHRDKNDSVRYVYKGSFKEGWQEGKGTEIYLDDQGDTVYLYEGYFVRSEKTGRGAVFSKVGPTHWTLKAQFEKGDVEGLVELVAQDSTGIIYNYSGSAKGGKREGFGEETFGHMKFAGLWKSNKRNGTGKLSRDTVTMYDGGWKDDRYHGVGSRTYLNGWKYKGGYKDGFRHGFGIHYWSDSTMYVGEFRNDLFHGFGYVVKQGKVDQVGLWENGQLTLSQPLHDVMSNLNRKYDVKLKFLER